MRTDARGRVFILCVPMGILRREGERHRIRRRCCVIARRGLGRRSRGRRLSLISAAGEGRPCSSFRPTSVPRRAERETPRVSSPMLRVSSGHVRRASLHIPLLVKVFESYKPANRLILPCSIGQVFCPRRRQRHPMFRQRFQHDRFELASNNRIVQPVEQRNPQGNPSTSSD